ncbi:neuropeptide receptor 15-like [Physella acuta]|uniref:neuropeptide receptor 15-like n=1 Tax=Physella acuta TaxID=109671 RepID=UPI0027DB5FA7|nr:neuropeptide receptor 15-like [Physella acuta]
MAGIMTSPPLGTILPFLNVPQIPPGVYKPGHHPRGESDIYSRLVKDQSEYYHMDQTNVRTRTNASLVVTYDVSAAESANGNLSNGSDFSGSHTADRNVSMWMSSWSTAVSTSPSQSSLPLTSQGDAAVTTAYIVVFSSLFFVVGSVGIAGNLMVVYIVLSDGKMRKSMTNMLILNLALADSLIMVFGLPEIVQFMMNNGWQLGQVACSTDRTVLVCALYSSVLTLVAVCIERYIAIVFPIKAHIFCTKRRILVVMVTIWMFSGLCATPTAVFNRVMQLSETPPQNFCIIVFHPNRTHHEFFNSIFKYTESALFYMGPLVIQVVCYAVIGKRLFVGVEKLHRNSGGISSASRPKGRGPARAYSEAIRARKGVVKMLMASVAIYFLSYSPHQVMLFYNLFSSAGFDATWVFYVFTTTLAYINSAANPVLYCVFSDNFRSKFKVIFHRFSCCACCCCRSTDGQRAISMHSYTEYTTLVRKNTQSQNSVPAVAL